MVAKFLDLDQQSFLTEAAICIEERWKKTMGYRFPKCKHSIFAGSRLVVQRDVTKKMTYNIILCADITQSDQVSTISFAVDSV